MCALVGCSFKHANKLLSEVLLLVKIKGIQKASLVDFEPHLVSTLFLGGCNLKCPFCQNPSLVLNPEATPDIPEDDVLSFLSSRKKWLDGVCITGGEPTIHKDLPVFIERIRKKGIRRIKLDTNGTNPLMLEQLIKKKLVDYVALDIKSSLEGYDAASGVKVEKENIIKSAKLLMDSGVDYEFRTTAVPDFFTSSHAISVSQWLGGAKRYAIQQFRDTKPLIGKSSLNKKPYSEAELNALKSILDGSFDQVIVKQ